MLLELGIQNIAIVEELRVRFEPGFSVLTGETGAGKSVILGALDLVLGERVKGDLLPSGASRGFVDALFEVHPESPLAATLETHSLIPEKGEPLHLRREIQRGGASRQYVNGQFVSLTLLKCIGDSLVDFHGQHDHQSLFRVDEHLNLLDHFADAWKIRREVETQFRKSQNLEAEIEHLKQLEKDRSEKQELLKFQIQEIVQAQLKEGEEEALQQERNRLAHAEKLRQLLQESLGTLSEQERSSEELIGGAYRNLQEAAKLDPSLQPASDQLKTIQIELREAVSTLQSSLDEIQADPARLEEIEQRLSLIWKLNKKYGGSLPEVLRFLSEQQEKMKQMESATERLTQLAKEKAALQSRLEESAKALSLLRRKAAPQLSKKVEKELRDLGMERCRFEVLFAESPLSFHGAETAEFLIAPNVGEPPRPLRSIASGGEISRVMLALKAVFAAASPVPTMIFDEIDTNIGGGVAEQVGKKMAALARSRQILCITHLPQVASQAQHHYRAQKRVARGRTQALISKLQPSEKTQELARMLSGEQVTQVALQHAQELLEGKRK